MTSPYFPFHALGLRCNPFRALTDEEWAEIALLPPGASAFCAGEVAHLQVLGEAGRGKSTTLLGLAAHFRREGQRAAYEYLADGQRGFRTETRGLDLFCLDEAQRLSGRERRRLGAMLRDGTPRVVLGSHEDWGPFFARHALTLATVDLDAGAEAHFRAALERRLAYFAREAGEERFGRVADTGAHEVGGGGRAPGPRVAFTPEAVRYLWETRGGNLRAVERFLYELFQGLRQPVAITPERLRAADEEPARTARCGAD